MRPGRIAAAAATAAVLIALPFLPESRSASPPAKNAATTTSTTLDCPTVSLLADAHMLAAEREALAANPKCREEMPELPTNLDENAAKASLFVAQARSAMAAKDTAGAHGLLLRALAADATNEDANSLLTGLSAAPPTTVSFGVARRLRDNGFEADARTAVVDAIKADAMGTPPSLRRTPVEWIRDNIRLVAALAVLALLILLRPLAQLLGKPRLAFAKEDGDLALLSAAARHALRGFEQTIAKPSLVLDLGPSTGVTLPPIEELEPRLKFVTKTVEWLTKPETLTAQATLTTAASGTRRAALELTDGANADSTIWQPPTTNDAALQILLAGAHAGGWLAITAPRMASNMDPDAALGTASANALASNTAGGVAWAEGENDIALQLFGAALAADPRFDRAKRNLGVALIGTGEVQAMVDGVSLLLETVDEHA